MSDPPDPGPSSPHHRISPPSPSLPPNTAGQHHTRPPTVPPPLSPMDSQLSPHSISPALACAVCTLLLINPTALRCGHSVCARHCPSSSDKQQPSCPVPSCNSAASPPTQLPLIPPQSRVRVIPAPADVPPPSSPPTPASVASEPRLDVTVNKVLALVSRTRRSLEDFDRHAGFLRQPSPAPSDRDTDNEDDESRLPDPDSTTRDRRNSSHRPRKRIRRHPPRRDEEPDQEEDHEIDLLSHLRRQAFHGRTVHHDEPLIPLNSASGPTDRSSILTLFEKELLAELSCEICFVLLYRPVTTPCQHTFCQKCLQRSLDHSANCPICRQQLPEFLYFQDHALNKVVLSLILEAFPEVYKERGDAIEQDERDSRLDTPIFVCQLSFPGMPTVLHFFEPRYRLMLRRCLESPHPRFGMVMPPRQGAASPHTDYGTMLEIRSVQMLPDGRSMVETWGSFRFRILERGTLDGYMVGRIERIDDFPEDLTVPVEDSEAAEPPVTRTSSLPSLSLLRPSSSLSSLLSPSPSPTSPSSRAPRPSRQPTNLELMATCRSFLDHLQRGTAPWVVQRLSSIYGPAPSDPASFSFWVALILPIDEQEKAKLLPLRSPRLRLLLVVHWIEQLNNNWYAWLRFVVVGWIMDGPAGLLAVWIALVLMVFRFLFGWV